MASIEHRGQSVRVHAYVDKDRITFPLGRVTKKTAERFANNIDTLLHERRCNLPVSREVSLWLADLDDTLHAMLSERGLVEPRQRVPTLAAFVGEYIASRKDVTDRRIGKLRNAADRIVEFFGDVKLETVTPGSADEYARWLPTQLAPATAQKECQIAAQFFRHAFRKGLIERNPFEGVTCGRATNEERRVFVTREVIDRVIDKCPDWQWRLVVALARYGGLRCPSEVAPLKWSDIHWDTDRITVTSPKTERYGKATRIVPLFPELRPYLDDAWAMAEDKQQWVVPMLGGNADKNLGTRLRKIIRRAGVHVWPKPFQNCRSSRQTELEQTFPTYVVCAWLGNTPTVATKHYLTVTEEHFQSAKLGNPLGMQPPAKARQQSPSGDVPIPKVPRNSSFSSIVRRLQRVLVAEEGFEPPTRGL